MDLNFRTENCCMMFYLDRWHFLFSAAERWKSNRFYLTAVFVCHWRNAGHSSCCIITLSYTVGKGRLLSYWLLFLKEFDVVWVKWNILLKWTYIIDKYSCVIVAFGIINFVGASENMISCLIHDLYLNACLSWIQLMARTVSRLEEHDKI
jgi:hypothetical protein